MSRQFFSRLRSWWRKTDSRPIRRADLFVESLGDLRALSHRPTRPIAPLAQLHCERLEDRVLPAVRVWNGGSGDLLASTPGNWDGGIAPVAGDSIVFQKATAPGNRSSVGE